MEIYYIPQIILYNYCLLCKRFSLLKIFWYNDNVRSITIERGMRMKFPIIGISGTLMKDNNDLFEGYDKAYVMDDYVQAVLRSGAVPIVLPIIDDSEKIKEYANIIDGLILTGGHDVNPLIYGEEPDVKTTEILPKRDFLDYELIKYITELNKPILAICRGMQILNTYHGGTLYQDNSYCKTFNIKHMQVHNPDVATHTIMIDNQSILNGVLGSLATVNSFHHQSVKDLANGFKIVARAKDYIVEAIEKEDEQWCVGVQFHPEILSSHDKKMQALFDLFIEAAK